MNRFKSFFYYPLITLLLLLIAGTSSGNPGPELPQEIVVSTVNQISNYVSTQEDKDQILKFLRSLPHLAEAEHDQMTNSIWARFTDGHLVSIILDRNTSEESPEDDFPDSDNINSIPSYTRPKEFGKKHLKFLNDSSNDLPTGDKAYVFDVNDFPPTHSKMIAESLQKGGYKVSSGAATVENLKSIKDADVLYIGTHGAALKDELGKEVFAIGSDTEFSGNCASDDVKCNQLWEERKVGELIIGVYPNKKKYWLVTTKFIEKHWSFNPRSLAYILTCSLGVNHHASNSFRDALNKKKVGTILAWTGLIGIEFGGVSAVYFFDRLLGANAFQAETPKQRPFNAKEVFKDVERKKYHAYNERTKLRLIQLASGPVILRPTIKKVFMDEETNTLKIYGQFGTELGKVSVGGINIPVEPSNWSRTEVNVKIPTNGPGSSGIVLVSVRDHKSNGVPLTSWRGSFEQVRKYTSIAPRIKHTFQCNIHLRADVHLYRVRPGDQPGRSEEVSFASASDSTCTYLYSGESPTTNSCKYALSGFGNLAWYARNMPGYIAPAFMFMGLLRKQDLNSMVIGMHQMAPGTLNQSCGSEPISIPFYSNTALSEMLYDPRPFDGNYNHADKRSYHSMQDQVENTWNFQATDAPTSDTES